MYRIAYITDLHLDEDFTRDHGTDPRKNWKRIAGDLAQRNIDQVIFGGDIGSVSSTQWLVQALQATGKPFYITPGNHDKTSEILQYFTPEGNFVPGQLYGLTAKENFTCIFLDSSSDKIDNEQLNWLTSTLQNKSNVIIFIHHPVFQITVMVDQLYPLLNRDAVRQVLINSTANIQIFCGHYHFNHILDMGKIDQTVTMAASCQLGDNGNHLTVDPSKFGYRIIELNGELITSEVIEFTRENENQISVS